MAKARTIAEVIAGEAVRGTAEERYRDMLAIASVIANRSTQLGVTPQQVVSVQRQFNAYGKQMPPGTPAYVSMAQRAIDEVAATGPINNATFYGTPAARGNLPEGLQSVARTTGHRYYTDPQNRSIMTSVGSRRPNARLASIPTSVPVPTAAPRSTSSAMALAAAPRTSNAMAAINSALAQPGAAVRSLPAVGPIPTSAPRRMSAAQVAPRSRPGTLADISYTNKGAIRDKPIKQSLSDDIQRGVTAVYGPGFRAEIHSGGQAVEGKGKRTGSTRHDNGRAADIHVVGPDGKRITGGELAKLGQHWAANKLGGVGMEMANRGIHLDNYTDRDMSWGYNTKKDKGTYTPEQQRMMAQGLRGVAPTYAVPEALDPETVRYNPAIQRQLATMTPTPARVTPPVAKAAVVPTTQRAAVAPIAASAPRLLGAVASPARIAATPAAPVRTVATPAAVVSPTSTAPRVATTAPSRPVSTTTPARIASTATPARIATDAIRIVGEDVTQGLAQKGNRLASTKTASAPAPVRPQLSADVMDRIAAGRLGAPAYSINPAPKVSAIASARPATIAPARQVAQAVATPTPKPANPLTSTLSTIGKALGPTPAAAATMPAPISAKAVATVRPAPVAGALSVAKPVASAAQPAPVVTTPARPAPVVSTAAKPAPVVSTYTPAKVVSDYKALTPVKTTAIAPAREVTLPVPTAAPRTVPTNRLYAVKDALPALPAPVTVPARKVASVPATAPRPVAQSRAVPVTAPRVAAPVAAPVAKTTGLGLPSVPTAPTQPGIFSGGFFGPNKQTIAGGVIGGLALGPVGSLLGAYLGGRIANGPAMSSTARAAMNAGTFDGFGYGSARGGSGGGLGGLGGMSSGSGGRGGGIGLGGSGPRDPNGSGNFAGSSFGGDKSASSTNNNTSSSKSSGSKSSSGGKKK